MEEKLATAFTNLPQVLFVRLLIVYSGKPFFCFFLVFRVGPFVYKPELLCYTSSGKGNKNTE